MFRQLQLLAKAVVEAERRGEVFAVRRTLQRIDRGELSFGEAAAYLRVVTLTGHVGAPSPDHIELPAGCAPALGPSASRQLLENYPNRLARLAGGT